MTLKASFRVVAADLITTRTDYLILRPYDIYFGSVDPSNLDYLEENVVVSIGEIKFDHTDSGLVTGFYGAGHYFAQIGTVSVTLSSMRPREVLRQDEYGASGGSGSSPENIGGFLFIGQPNEFGIRRVIYRGRLVSTIEQPHTIVSLWLNAANATTKSVCEIELEAFGNPFDEINAFTLKFPNMPGVSTANLMYGENFLPPC